MKVGRVGGLPTAFGYNGDGSDCMIVPSACSDLAHARKNASMPGRISAAISQKSDHAVRHRAPHLRASAIFGRDRRMIVL